MKPCKGATAKPRVKRSATLGVLAAALSSERATQQVNRIPGNHAFPYFCAALTGLPRVSPWALLSRPFRVLNVNAGTAEPFRVSPPEAVVYFIQLEDGFCDKDDGRQDKSRYR